MIITKTENYTLLKPKEDSIKLFFESFKNKYTEFEGQHLIFDFSEIINTKVEDLLLFLEIGYQHKEKGTSFALVVKGIDIDDIPEEINVVPTITEAVDILEMDAIERDLGF
jgi:hypothetical protein